jgi:hypothetical protein
MDVESSQVREHGLGASALRVAPAKNMAQHLPAPTPLESSTQRAIYDMKPKILRFVLGFAWCSPILQACHNPQTSGLGPDSRDCQTCTAKSCTFASSIECIIDELHIPGAVLVSLPKSSALNRRLQPKVRNIWRP